MVSLLMSEHMRAADTALQNLIKLLPGTLQHIQAIIEEELSKKDKVFLNDRDIINRLSVHTLLHYY